MTHGEGGEPPRDAAPSGTLVATASYVSTAEILERESRHLARWQLSGPGFWRSFVRRRVVVAVLMLAVVVSLAQTDAVTASGALRGLIFLLASLAALSVMDAWLTRRRVLRAFRAVATTGCPPGTVVSATYTLGEFTFGRPGHRTVVETASLSGVHSGSGLLRLEHTDGSTWVVPDELLGAQGLAVVRAALGDRLVEG